jgi:hypothetical protein
MTQNGATALGAKSYLSIDGIGTLTVWERGTLSKLLKTGMSLPKAMKTAKERGLSIFTLKQHNLITSVGKAQVGDLLIDQEATGITYCALGTSNTSPSVGDTTLGTEVRRKSITSRDRSANEITLSTFFLASESTYNIKEVGWFGGDAASGAANSGIMFNHYLQSYDNSAGTYDLTFEYVLTIGA